MAQAFGNQRLTFAQRIWLSMAETNAMRNYYDITLNYPADSANASSTSMAIDYSTVKNSKFRLPFNQPFDPLFDLLLDLLLDLLFDCYALCGSFFLLTVSLAEPRPPRGLTLTKWHLPVEFH